MKTVYIHFKIAEKSPYTNQKVAFEVKDSEDLERQLIQFLKDVSLDSLLDDQSGKIKNLYSFINKSKLYRSLKEIELEDQAVIDIVAMVVGG